MARKKRYRLGFPAFGVDKSIAHAAQQPRGCYDSLNALPRDSLENRVRGGSRPGIVELLYGGPASSATMLAMMEMRPDSRESEFVEDFTGQEVRTDTLEHTGWSQLAYESSTLEYPEMKSDSFLSLPSGETIAGAARTWHSMDSFDSAEGYEVSLLLSPPQGGYASGGKVHLCVGLTSDKTPETDGVLLTLEHVGDDFSMRLRGFDGGGAAKFDLTSDTTWAVNDYGLTGEGYSPPGWLTLRVFPDSGSPTKLGAWWRGQYMYQTGSPAARAVLPDSGAFEFADHRIGLIIEGATAPRVDAVRVRHLSASTLPSPHQLAVVAFRSGAAYRQVSLADSETSTPTLYSTDEIIPIDAGALSTNRWYTATEFQGGLYFSQPTPPEIMFDKVRWVKSPESQDYSVVNVRLMTADEQSLVGAGDYISLVYDHSVANDVEGVYLIDSFITGAYTEFRVKNLDGVSRPEWGLAELASVMANGCRAFIHHTHPEVYLPANAQPPNTGDEVTDTYRIIDWDANEGWIPHGCPLIAQYLGRLVLAGMPPNMWYMSRRGAAGDWDYYASDDGRAMAGTLSDSGSSGEPITALAPFGDDYLLMGARSSLWRMSGDPGLGGTLDNISHSIGVAGAFAWTTAPTGEFVFMPRSGGVYILAYESQRGWFPVPVSEIPLPRDLMQAPQSAHIVMAFDTSLNGVWIAPMLSGPNAEPYVWFMEWATKGFWRHYLRRGHLPSAIVRRLSPVANETGVMWASPLGTLLGFNRSVFQDLEYGVSSWVRYGPLKAAGGGSGIIQKMDASIDNDSADVNWGLYVGQTAESAHEETTAVQSGTWRAGRNYANRPRVRMPQAVLQVGGDFSNHHPWALEEITVDIVSAGERRKL